MIDQRSNALLGYPDGARLLMINADDFGMCHAVNDAILQVLTGGMLTSTSLMVPCPWAPQAMRMLKHNPDVAFGVHLTLVAEFGDYRWGPVSPWNTVPTLVDASSHFHSIDRIPELLDGARLDEVEMEFRAQIDAALADGLQPTHLDWHCIADGGREDIFELTLALAQEYGLALRTHKPEHGRRCLDAGLPASEYGVLDSYGIDPDDKPVQYARLLRELPPGLSEWAVHPSLGDAEARALEPNTWRIRRADLDFFLSSGARDLIEQEGIVLVDYRALQAVWAQAGKSSSG